MEPSDEQKLALERLASLVLDIWTDLGQASPDTLRLPQPSIVDRMLTEQNERIRLERESQ